MEILQSWFCMIPNVVLYDTELSDKQKLLYWVISSLCAEKWYCWASNDYISELLWVNKWTISKNISELEKRWYINITLNNKYIRYIELNSVVENHNSCDKSQGGLWKITRGGCEKSQHININDKDNNIIINNNTEENNSLSLNNSTLVDKEKEKSSAKKEKEELTDKINQLILTIKWVCMNLWIMYDKTMERQFAKHILTAKEFGDNAELCKMDRITFAINIMNASNQIKYRKWTCNWPKSIYQNYVDVYNQTKQKAQKTFTPTIQVL